MRFGLPCGAALTSAFFSCTQAQRSRRRQLPGNFISAALQPAFSITQSLVSTQVSVQPEAAGVEACTWQTPTVVVDLPSPSGVGVMPPTTTYLPFGRSPSSLSTESRTCIEFRQPVLAILGDRKQAPLGPTTADQVFLLCRSPASAGTVACVLTKIVGRHQACPLNAVRNLHWLPSLAMQATAAWY